ncbi:cation diffusion facilitator family transporter [Sulfurovum sp.]|uniref:cation diffusion facilitator family transporter n=1 Tax=Sulfurovum sp. TaxID=1969726 RepID=UPI0025DBEB9A|nr:cation diffusion facilitator family transporter [Sulfurovum sp.]
MISHIRKTDEKQRWLFASTLLNAALAAAKLGWGWMMGSTLVVADGIHSISDVFGALLIFLALFFAAHKSERFPYGLHKLEDLAAVLGGLGILYAGYEIVNSVFFEAGIETPREVWTTIGFILAIILVQFIFYFFELKAAQRLKSPGVKADAINWLGDIGAGFIVVIGLAAHHYEIPYAQEAAVIIIVIMILAGAYDVLKEGLLSLLDAADIEMNDTLRKIVMTEPDITNIKRLNVRKSGSVYFADIELNVAEVNAAKAHSSIDAVVNELHRKIPSLEAVTIHYEPEHPPYETIVKLLDEDKKHLSTHFGRTTWLEITHVTQDEQQVSQKLVKNPALDAPKGKAFRLIAYLLSIHTDRVIMGNADLDENILTLFDALDIEIGYQGEP